MRLISVLAWACLLGIAASAPCASNSYADAFVAASFSTNPTTNLPSASTYTSGKSFIQNHWSEVAKMERPSTPASSVYTQTNCPHAGSGLRNWHDTTLWTVPAADGNAISLPANTKVLISGCSLATSGTYGVITIPEGSELIFADSQITLNTKGINVLGALRIGSPTCRMSQAITITLFGSRPASASLPASPEIKGIYVSQNGVLEVFGAKYFPTWTRLATTAKPGDTVIFVQDLVNWKAGQSIVITTTELKDSRDWHRNEIATISNVYTVTSVGPKVSAIVLSSALTYTHYGGSEYQAEVALLSRDVVIQGSSTDSEPTDQTPLVCNDTNSKSQYPCSKTFLTGFGGHVQINGGTASGRVGGVEFFRMGQTNALGRYPFHIHLVGQNGSNSYITDSAIHRSFFRCVAIHGSSNALVTENVAFDAIGHCYYLEDGVEENNTFSYNFGGHIHYIGDNQNISQGTFGAFWSQGLGSVKESIDNILPADFSASAFYITNAYNTFTGNAASGGWAGYAFPNLPKAIKLSASTAIIPKDRKTKLFKGNSAHSTAYWWSQAGAIYLGGQLTTVSSSDSTLVYFPGRSITRDTCDGDSSIGYCPEQAWMRFEDNKVFLANGRGMQHWGDRAEIIRFEAHDCGLSMNVFGTVWVDQLLVNCRTEYSLTLSKYANCWSTNWWECATRDYYFWSGYYGFQWYDVWQTHIVTNSKFRNCKADWSGCFDQPCWGATPWLLLTHSDQFVPDMMQTTKNITYENVTPGKLFTFSTKLEDSTGVTVSGRLQNWRDEDGTAYTTTPKTPRQRYNLGSTWSGTWWKTRDTCTVQSQMFACPLEDEEFVASFVMHFDKAWENQIGQSVCMNGGGVYPCTVVANVTHFGREEGSGSLQVGVNAKVTGPVIKESGGWFIRFGQGTPAVLSFDFFQIFSTDKLLIALPYKPGTTFVVNATAADWCGTWNGNVCKQKFASAKSIEEVRNGDGNLYYFDNSKGLLYLRLVQQEDGSLGSDDVWKQKNMSEIYTFSRGGVTMVQRTYGAYKVSIYASNCGASGLYCEPVLPVVIPEALFGEKKTNNNNNNGASKLPLIVGASIGAVLVVCGVVGVVVAYKRGKLFPKKATRPGTVFI